MKAKSIITIILLAFVAVSIIYLFVREAGTTEEGAADINNFEDQPAHKVVAYYFHGFKRCKTCLKIESSAKETIESAFQKELNSGTLEWKVVNFEEENNANLATKYELVASSLIIVDVANGQETRWKNLERVWELVWEDELYSDYVKQEVAEYLFSDINDG